MITVKSQGDFHHTDHMLEFLRGDFIVKILEHYGEIGKNALADATPIDTGLAAHSWEYKVHHRPGKYTLSFINTDVEGDGYNVIMGIQYGHSTGTGGWVQGYDFINPIIKPLFDKILADVLREVKRV